VLLGSVLVMTDDDGLVIEYSGSAAHVSAFAQALTDQGLQVRYTRPPAPEEQRGVPDPQTFVHAYVLIEAWASDHPLATDAAVATAVYTRVKVDAAIDRWRKGRLARAAEVKVKGPRHRAG